MFIFLLEGFANRTIHFSKPEFDLNWQSLNKLRPETKRHVMQHPSCNLLGHMTGTRKEHKSVQGERFMLLNLTCAKEETPPTQQVLEQTTYNTGARISDRRS